MRREAVLWGAAIAMAVAAVLLVWWPPVSAGADRGFAIRGDESEEMPSIERLHRELRGQGLVVLALDVDEAPERVAKFVKDFRLGFPVLLDAASHVFSSYGAPGLPTTILIDRQGRVIGGALGPRDWASDAGRALMRTLLEQQVSGGI